MSTGIWMPLYPQLLKAALIEFLKNEHACSMAGHKHSEIDDWTYEVLAKGRAKVKFGGIGGHNGDLVDWRFGVWDEAVHIAMLEHCPLLTLDDVRQSLFRLAIRKMIRRLIWNPMHDDCEPWPRWKLVDPLTALASV